MVRIIYKLRHRHGMKNYKSSFQGIYELQNTLPIIFLHNNEDVHNHNSVLLQSQSIWNIVAYLHRWQAYDLTMIVPISSEIVEF